jgi:hypothetical protein
MQSVIAEGGIMAPMAHELTGRRVDLDRLRPKLNTYLFRSIDIDYIMPISTRGQAKAQARSLAEFQAHAQKCVSRSILVSSLS